MRIGLAAAEGIVAELFAVDLDVGFFLRSVTLPVSDDGGEDIVQLGGWLFRQTDGPNNPVEVE